LDLDYLLDPPGLYFLVDLEGLYFQLDLYRVVLLYLLVQSFLYQQGLSSLSSRSNLMVR
jgi:hypothetical protein